MAYNSKNLPEDDRWRRRDNFPPNFGWCGTAGLTRQKRKLFSFSCLALLLPPGGFVCLNLFYYVTGLFILFS
jgi:hypothetical protein